MAGQGGKGGGAVQAPNNNLPKPPGLTDRGTFFNDQGVEMMPMRGPGGAAPIPLSEYNEKYGQQSMGRMPRNDLMLPPPTQPPQQPFNVNNAAATGLQNSMGATTNLLNSPIDQGAYANAATLGLGQSMGTTSNLTGSPIDQAAYSNAATTGLGQALGTTGDLTSGLINQTGYRDAGASGLGQSMDTTSDIMSGPLNVDQFNNPYQQQVVDTVQQDIERQRQLAMNNLGAQAQAAGAYGGSRQGVAEGVTNAEYGRMAANALAPLRAQGYNTSVANAMADRSARLGAAGQLGNLANTALGNAFTDRTQQLGAAGQQGNLANTILGNVFNARGQQLGAAGQQGNLANTMLGNVFNARGQQMGAAGQLSNMANQAFNTGRTINQDLANQGLLQQSLQQALIDAARGDFANYASAPMNSLTTPLAALGASPKPYQQTTSQNPGLLGTLGALKYIMGPQAAALPF